MAELTKFNMQQIRSVVNDELTAVVPTMIKKELNRLELLFEDLNSSVKKQTEAISDNLKLKNQVDAHETRITDLETDCRLVTSTITSHSKDINKLTGRAK